jgi:hypothetical protein
MLWRFHLTFSNWARTQGLTSVVPLPAAAVVAAALAGRKEGREGEEELQMKLAELHSAIYLQARTCQIAAQQQASRRC